MRYFYSSAKQDHLSRGLNSRGLDRYPSLLSVNERNYLFSLRLGIRRYHSKQML